MAKADPRQKHSAAKHSPPAPKPTHRAAVKPARMPKGSAAPPGPLLSSRTTTVDDPMTTSLLAEASRQRSTVEIRPEELERAIAAGAADRDPTDDPTDDPIDDPTDDST